MKKALIMLANTMLMKIESHAIFTLFLFTYIKRYITNGIQRIISMCVKNEIPKNSPANTIYSALGDFKDKYFI